MDFEEMGRSAKSLLKNKKFQIAMIVVGMVALILWIIRQNRTTTTTTETFDYYDGTQAIGYGGYGYPYAGESNEQDFDWLYERLDGLSDLIEEGNAAQDEKWQSMYDAMSDRLDALGNGDDEAGGSSGRPIGGHGSATAPAVKVDEQAVIDAMEQNSNAWWDVTDKTGRDYLHAENQYLGSLIGATYDNQTGIWSKDGLPLYNVNKGDPMTYVTTTGSRKSSTPASNPTPSYVANVDYQAAINEAILTGQSSDVINQLNTARNNKIAATGQSGSTFQQSTDYQALINKAKEIGADQSVIDSLTAQRQAKLNAAAGKTTVNGTAVTSGGTKRVNYTK